MPSGTQKEDLVALIDKIKNNIEGDDVSVADIQEALGRRSFGPLLLIAGLLAILPTGLIPGMGWGTGTIMTVTFAQLLVGAQRLVLPGFIKHRSLKRETVEKTLERVRPWAEWMSRYSGPRLDFLLRAPFLQLVALSGLAMALTMFPLGSVPFGAFPGGVSSIVIGIGLAVRDGLFIAVGILLGVLGILLSGWLITLL